VWSIGGWEFIHSFDEVRSLDFMMLRDSAIASQMMKISIRIANMDITDPIDEIKFHVV